MCLLSSVLVESWEVGRGKLEMGEDDDVVGERKSIG